MKAYDPRKPLISIHIPKCAGSSFSQILKEWFKEGFLPHYHNEKKNEPPKKHNLYTGSSDKEMRPGLCIHGHFNSNRGNGVRDYYPEVDQFITIIRDPFDLHLSTYFYVKRQAQSQGEGAFRSGKKHRILASGWNLEDYLREEKKSYILKFLPSNISAENYQQVLESGFIYIGISERLQKSVDIPAKKLGFLRTTVPKENVSDWNEPVPDGAREKFENNNPLEVSIYRYATNNWANNL